MGLLSKSSDDVREYKAAKQEHNARFNNATTDPDSDDFVESHARIADAAQNVGWLRRG